LHRAAGKVAKISPAQPLARRQQADGLEDIRLARPVGAGQHDHPRPACIESQGFVIAKACQAEFLEQQRHNLPLASLYRLFNRKSHIDRPFCNLITFFEGKMTLKASRNMGKDIYCLHPHH
jgi:hypothetical protein